MDSATSRTNPHRTGQPIEIPIGPPAVHAKEKFVKHPARTEMIVNEIAKLVKLLQFVAEVSELALVLAHRSRRRRCW
jgi:hypothetical protein